MRLTLLTISFFICSGVFAQKIDEKLSAAVKALEADPQFKHAIFSMYVVDSKTGAIVYEKNAQLGLAPASCQKVVTSVSAFEMLGHDYSYKTRIGHDGTVKDGTLNGNLIIVASGDPTFGSWRWNETDTQSIKQKIVGILRVNNIAAVSGNVIVDESSWDNQATPNGWTWDDIGNYYGAGARGFNWYENQYDIVLRSHSNESSWQISEIRPNQPLINFVNQLQKGPSGSGDNSIIYLPEEGSTAYLRGTLPEGQRRFTISGAMPNPIPPFFETLKNCFDSAHIKILGGYKAFRLGTRYHNDRTEMKTSLTTLISPSFDSINYWFLKRSVNLYGEALVKTIAFEKTKFGSTDTGLAIIKNFWKDKGIEPSALHIIDGSGLSPANRVTTNALVTIMQYAKNQTWFPSFYNALPELNAIKMKDGYISGVRSFTGYVKSKDGNEYTFSFIVNNFDGSAGTVREKMWKVLDILK